MRLGPPAKQGLYDPAFEHDACGVGFVVDIKGRQSHKILQQGIQVLRNLDQHRRWRRCADADAAQIYR
jgi:glutamate synthase domain-containing protein 1